ncbi:hypothetical protein ABZT03_05425 [Streptomyces sp. NPDC005574]|uniref:hypothetical protein n=1 Tax=Streptomyces sp. NPDC005574 TaxID=3156891 RepID=UPI0033B5A7BF
MRNIKRVATTLAGSAVVLTTMAAPSASAAPLPVNGIAQTLPALWTILAFVRRTLL